MNIERFKYWSFLVSKFLAGQGAIQALNLITGFLILRFLPISEYALYTVSSVLLAVGSLGSDMGISQGMITFGARLKDDKQGLSSLFVTALGFRRWLYLVTTGVVVGLSPFMMTGHNWSILSIMISVLFVLITNWVQQTVSLKNSILNIFHDSTGLMQTGLGNALLRFSLTVTWCRLVPIAVVALVINLAGFMVGDFLLKKRCSLYIKEGAKPSNDQGLVLKEFIYPLVPGVIYYLLQGQISMAILSFFGHTSSIAEVGALGRLGQALGLLMLLNAFFVQPHFALIHQKREFIEKGLLVLSGIVLLCSMVLISSFIIPEWWLFILGAKYAGLNRELPLAVFAPLLLLVNGTLYTMLIAKSATRGQSWMIAAGITIQIMFIAFNGINSTHDALLLNVLVALGGVMVQSSLLTKVLFTW